MPSSPMLITPARSDHSPPRPASRIGSSSSTAAWVVPREVSWYWPVSVAVIESSTTPTATTSAERAHGRQRRRRRGGGASPDSRSAPSAPS